MTVKLKTVEEAETYTTIALAGSLDMAGAWEIERDLIDYISGAMCHLLIDMSAVDLLGSMGIRVLVRSASSLQRERKKLVLFAAQPMVEKTLNVTGFNSAIPVVPTLNDAKTAIGA